jgi:excisionase family DNA binding protein
MAHCAVPEIPFRDRRSFSLGEVSGLTGLCVATLYSLIGRGQLKSIKVGGRRLVTTEALNQLLTSHDPPAKLEPEPDGVAQCLSLAAPTPRNDRVRR